MPDLIDTAAIATQTLATIKTIGMWGAIFVLGIAPAFLFVWNTKFKFKCLYREVNGDGRGGYMYGKERTTSFCWADKDKTTWKCKADNFGFTHKIHPSAPAHLIYNGNRVYALRLPNGDFVWVQWAINTDDKGNLISSLHTVPVHLRAWQAMEHQKVASEWRDNKKELQGVLIMVAAIIGAALVMGVSMYFAYKFGSPTLADLQANTNALNSLANAIGGKVAGPVPVG